MSVIKLLFHDTYIIFKFQKITKILLPFQQYVLRSSTNFHCNTCYSLWNINWFLNNKNWKRTLLGCLHYVYARNRLTRGPNQGMDPHVNDNAECGTRRFATEPSRPAASNSRSRHARTPPIHWLVGRTKSLTHMSVTTRRVVRMHVTDLQSGARM